MPDTETPEQRLGIEVRNLRRESFDWSQAELADRLKRHGVNWHQTTVAKVEAGERPVRLNEVIALAEVLNVPPVSLIEPGGPTTADLAAAEAKVLRARASIERAEQVLAAAREMYDRVVAERDTLKFLRGS
jgi:transcriptional regulator with XRE-family HTH domain